MSRFETRRGAKLRELASVQPLVAGSLCLARRTCGRPSCRCARGEPHWAWALTFKVAGKTRTVHVPKDIVEEVRKWVNEHKRVKRLIREISSLSLQIIHRHVPASRAAGKRSNR